MRITAPLRTLAVMLAVLAGIGALPALPASAASQAMPLSGSTKFDTAVAVSRNVYPDGAAEVFIANEQGAYDAIVAAPAAASRDAPVLLTDSGSLPQATADEVRRLKPGRITIIGGASPVGYQAEAQLRQAAPGAVIERIAGSTAQDTAIAIQQRFFPSAAQILVPSETAPLDIASAASAGSRLGLPVIPTGSDELSQPMLKALAQLRPARVTLVGGYAHVVDRLGRQMTDTTRGAWDRVGADDSHVTSALVARRFFDRDSGPGIALVNGAATPDFPAGAYLGRFGIPLLMVGGSCARPETIQQAQALALDDGEPIRLIGGHSSELSLNTSCPASTRPPASCSIGSTFADPAALSSNARFSVSGAAPSLLDRGAEQMVPLASTMKIVTAIAAYHVLGPDFQIRTYMFHGTQPGSYVISGGGDPTLRSGWSSLYKDAPTIIAFSNLARSLGATSVSYDSWVLPGPTWHPGWSPEERPSGSMAPMDSLMMDGGRADANVNYSPRSAQPAWDAGMRFANLTGVRFDPTIRADPSRGIVGQVASAPVRTLVAQMFLYSDNAIAEALARQVAMKLGYAGSYDQVAPALHQVLWSLGIDPGAGLYASDGSGLSRWTEGTATFMDQALQYLEQGPGTAAEILPMMPESRRGGPLAFRFVQLPLGAVIAKSGTVDYAYGLVGWINAADGTRLRFSVFVWKSRSGAYVTSANRDALDRIVAAAYSCGSRLG